MAQTALFVRPMARKKPVPMKYAPNSYRVISTDAEGRPPPKKLPPPPVVPKADRNVIGQPSDVRRPSGEFRHNRPNPEQVGFLRQDVRLLNEPICNVHTRDTQPEQNSWWPSRFSDAPLHRPSHTLDTNVREDFQYRGNEMKGSTRHSSNPNKSAARGVVPVNFLHEPDGKPRVWKESISYEHQYNSRAQPSYPIRAKRHGGFVWDPIGQIELQRLHHHHGYHDIPPAAEDQSKPPSGKHVTLPPVSS